MRRGCQVRSGPNGAALKRVEELPGVVPGAMHLAKKTNGGVACLGLLAIWPDFFSAGMRLRACVVRCCTGKAKKNPVNADAKPMMHASMPCPGRRLCSRCTGGGHAYRWPRPRTGHRRLRTGNADWHKVMRSSPADYHHKNACGIACRCSGNASWWASELTECECMRLAAKQGCTLPSPRHFGQRRGP